jgi:hypothetical protein
MMDLDIAMKTSLGLSRMMLRDCQTENLLIFRRWCNQAAGEAGHEEGGEEQGQN